MAIQIIPNGKGLYPLKITSVSLIRGAKQRKTIQKLRNDKKNHFSVSKQRNRKTIKVKKKEKNNFSMS